MGAYKKRNEWRVTTVKMFMLIEEKEFSVQKRVKYYTEVYARQLKSLNAKSSQRKKELDGPEWAAKMRNVELELDRIHKEELKEKSVPGRVPAGRKTGKER